MDDACETPPPPPAGAGQTTAPLVFAGPVASRARAARRKSTGPRTAAGKLRSAQNSRNSKGPRTLSGKLRAAQNARQSTGPTTAAGKKRSAQNARRHGLNVPACRDPAVAGRIVHLSCAIAAANEHPQVIALAQRVAAAQVDLMRARRARLELLGAKPLGNIHRLAAIERYERRARAQRAVAIRAFDAARAFFVAQGKRPSWRNELNRTQCDKTN